MRKQASPGGLPVSRRRTAAFRRMNRLMRLSVSIKGVLVEDAGSRHGDIPCRAGKQTAAPSLGRRAGLP